MKKIALLASILLFASVSMFAQDRPTAWFTSGNGFSGTDIPFVGSTNNYPFALKTNNTLRMYLDTNGNIGVNTQTPHQMFHVVDGNILLSHSSTRAPGSYNGSILFGTETSPSCPYGVWGIEYVNNETEGYGLNFWKTWSCSTGFNHALFLADNGNVGIGTKNPQAKLAVNGGILAKSVRVNTGSTYWPDYVFEDGYTLMDLRELDAYVTTNKHLPGVPSAHEVNAGGSVDLGKMNTLLLEKVEELTRYVIDLQKQIDELKAGKE